METLPEKKIFHNHRDNQVERILEAAQKLFIQEGIDNVSMGEIADAARLARKTLYQYFSNKQEIAFAIFQKMVDWQVLSSDLIPLPPGNGFQRTEAFVMGLISMLETYPEQIRFMVEFDTLYARGGDPAKVRQFYVQGAEVLVPIIRQGVADGSISPDVDPDFAAAAIFNLLSGMNSRFALLGNQISEEYGRPVMELYRGICRIFLRGIQCSSVDQTQTK
jgi:AcrR family transcriptional regulator